MNILSWLGYKPSFSPIEDYALSRKETEISYGEHPINGSVSHQVVGKDYDCSFDVSNSIRVDHRA